MIYTDRHQILILVAWLKGISFMAHQTGRARGTLREEWTSAGRGPYEVINPEGSKNQSPRSGMADHRIPGSGPEKSRYGEADR